MTLFGQGWGRLRSLPVHTRYVFGRVLASLIARTAHALPLAVNSRVAVIVRMSTRAFSFPAASVILTAGVLAGRHFFKVLRINALSVTAQVI
jgi:hypothetical protein